MCYKVLLGLLSKVYNICLVSVCYLLSFPFLCVTFPCVTFCDRRNDRHTEQIRLIDYRLTKIANFFRVGLCSTQAHVGTCDGWFCSTAVLSNTHLHIAVIRYTFSGATTAAIQGQTVTDSYVTNLCFAFYIHVRTGNTKFC